MFFELILPNFCLKSVIKSKRKAKEILGKNHFFGLDGKSVKFWTFLGKNDQKFLSKIPKGYLNFKTFNADFKSFYRFEIAYLVPKIFEFW